MAVYSDRMVFIWNAHDLKDISIHSTFVQHGSTIYDLKAINSKKSTRFITGSTDKSLKLWRLVDEITSSTPTNVYCKDLEYSIFLGDNFKHFKDLPIPGEIQQQATNLSKDGIVRCVAVSSDARFVACGDLEGNLRVYNIEAKDYPRVAFIEAHNSEILSLDFVILDDG